MLTCASIAAAPSLGARAQSTDGAAAQPPPSWSSPSLRNETVVGPNGAITTSTALLANDKWGIGDRKRVEKVTDGVYAMRGWGIASSFAIEAPDGWIVIDTGDHTQAAAEMRAMLEQTLGRKIKVAAILLTHLHYANGSGAFLDPGAEIWGHEHLDRNVRATTGISVLSGTYQARAAAQFGVFHPTSGPDAFPNKLGFTPEKLLAASSYQPPTTAVPGRSRRRRGRGRRAGAGRSPADGHERQRRLLLPRQAPARHQLHAIRRGVQHLLAARRFVPQSGGVHPGRALG